MRAAPQRGAPGQHGPGGRAAAAARWRIRAATTTDAADAVALLREAARWTAGFGAPIWDAEAFTVPAYQAYAEVGELVGAFWAVIQARAAHAGAVRLDTLPTGRLPALYASLGFGPADAGPRWIDGRRVLRMERRL